MPKGLGKWLVKTGLFEERAEGETEPKAPREPGTVPISTRPSAIAVQSAYPAPLAPDAMTGQDRKFYEGLDELMEHVSSAGFLAFLKMLDVLGQTLREPAMLFQAAYNTAMASNPGLSVDELFHEIQDCYDVLTRERQALETSLSKRVQDQVGKAQAEATTIQQQIAAANAQIRQWQTRLQTLQSTIEGATASADQDRASYGRAASAHEQELSQLKANVQLFLAPQTVAPASTPETK